MEVPPAQSCAGPVQIRNDGTADDGADDVDRMLLAWRYNNAASLARQRELYGRIAALWVEHGLTDLVPYFPPGAGDGADDGDAAIVVGYRPPTLPDGRQAEGPRQSAWPPPRNLLPTPPLPSGRVPIDPTSPPQRMPRPPSDPHPSIAQHKLGSHPKSYPGLQPQPKSSLGSHPKSPQRRGRSKRRRRHHQ